MPRIRVCKSTFVLWLYLLCALYARPELCLGLFELGKRVGQV
jgi:hypothetical protein